MPKVSIEEARSTIRKVLQGEGGRILPSPYCRQRMLQRQVFMEDITHVLFWGTMMAGTHPGDAEKNVFRVSGVDRENDPLTIVIRIISTQKIIEVITVFGELHESS